MAVTRWMMGLVSLIVAALAIANFSRLPPELDDNSASARWLQPGFYAVGSEPLEIADRSRRTPANGEFDGSSRRRFDGVIWYPMVENKAVAPGFHPLIIYSHGFSSNHQEGAHIGKLLASRGYIVVAVDYPLTHMQAPGGPLAKDVLNQAGDVSFLIDTLLARNARPKSAFYRRVDSQRIGVVGISLGGMTSTLAAFHPRWSDPRIAAAISLAGPTEMFGQRFFQHRQVPFMLVAGDIDALVPYAANGAPMVEKYPAGWLVTLRGASHAGFADPARYLRWLANPDWLGCQVVAWQLSKAELESPWYDQLGDAADGIVEPRLTAGCSPELPDALNPLRQHQLTLLAVAAFFERYFADTEHERDWADKFLRTEFVNENKEVEIYAGQ